MAQVILSSPLERLLKNGYLSEKVAQTCAEAVGKVYRPARRPSREPVALGKFPEPVREEENPAALFRRGWLRKGGGAFVVAPSGVGKSVFTLQAAVCWAMGRPAFGVAPVRPLKILVIQSEDDREEIAQFRNSVRRGLADEFGFDEGEINFVLGTDDAATARVLFHQAVGLWGEAFVEEVGALLDAYPDIDLVIVNPFQAYFGGDCAKNAELSQFFRSWLDREIKDPGDEGKDRAAVMFVHHTNKPPNDRDLREGWGTDMFAAYIGAGGAEIVNWARAILSIMPTKVAGVYRLVAGKRGQRLGWTDAEGRPVYSRLIKHADNGRIYWREGTPEDEAAVAGCCGGKRGAVGGDGSGGVPPVREPRCKPLMVVSYVDCHPDESERRCCEGLRVTAGVTRTTARRLFAQAVADGLLEKAVVDGAAIYSVTVKGRASLVAAPL